MRDDHLTKKEKCKYHTQNRCSFSAKSCWNSHESSEPEKESENHEQNKCFSCHMSFNTRNGMMRHKKQRHIEEVRECLKFRTGDCGFSNEFCWNKHTIESHKINTHDEQVFHKRSGKMVPPGNTSPNQNHTESLAGKN